MVTWNHLRHHADDKTFLLDIVGLDSVGIFKDLAGVDELLQRWLPAFFLGDLGFDIGDLQGSGIVSRAGNG